MKYYYMLQNARVTAFTVSELFRENQQQRGGAEGRGNPPTHTPRLGFKNFCYTVTYVVSILEMYL